WAQIAQTYGLTVHRVCTDWTREVSLTEVAEALRGQPGIRAVLLAYCDTANGVRNDVAGVAKAARLRGVMTLVDGGSSLGGMAFSFDEWDVDVAITASQKCLMSGPGLALAVCSERGWPAAKKA